MTAIDFPSTPSSGQEVVVGGVTYKWNGIGWTVKTAPASYTKAESDARFEPFDSAYTKAESDARYAQSTNFYDKTASDTRYVNAAGDTMSGALTVTGNIAATGELNTGVGIVRYPRGYLYDDGSFYQLHGAPLKITSQILYTNNIYLSNDSNSCILWDSANVLVRYGVGGFYLQTGSGATRFVVDNAGNTNAIGNFVANGSIVAGAHATLGSANYGLLYFSNSATRYLEFNGTQYTLVGGPLAVNSNFTCGTIGCGAIACTTINTQGNGISCSTLNATGAIHGNQLWTDGGGLYFANNGGLYLVWEAGSGRFVCSHTLHSNGNLTATGNVQALTCYYMQGRLILNADSAWHYIYDTDGNQCFQMGGFAAGYAMYYRGTNHYFNGAGNAGAWGTIDPTWSQFWGTGGLQISAEGYKPGGGSWVNNSDIRVKTVLGDYKNGLAQILALKPVRYVFKGNDSLEPPRATREIDSDPEVEASKSIPSAAPYPNSIHFEAATQQREFVGLIAQQAETVMPELVKKVTGYIDGQQVTDLRTLDASAITYALINAVQELAAEVAALKAAARR